MSLFSQVPIRKPKRNVFNLGYESKLSCNMGELIPIMCQPVVPGDTFQNQSELFLRFAPMLAPIMHSVYITTHFFFVPNRLVWNEWEDFITGGKDGTAAPVFPRLNFSQAATLNSYLKEGSLADYLGLNTVSGSVGNTPNPNYFSALPFRAYQLIYNEYYRDQNLSDPIEFSLDSGIINLSTEFGNLCTLRQRAWQKDYFTSALPWAQRGAPVTLPLGGDAPVNFVPNGNSPQLKYGDGTLPSSGALESDASYMSVSGSTGATSGLGLDPKGTLRADLSDATAASINDLLTAQKLQEWLTKNARGGARYIEQIMSHFGVRSSDARLQRPEFLGGGKDFLAVSEVLQTSATQTDSTPLGDFAGHGVAQSATHTFRRFFEEHGYIIGILSILPKTAYQQGVPRDFLKFDKMDFYFPEFAHLGEQDIKSGELYYDYFANVDSSGLTANEKTFGYTPRYAEYKFNNSQVHGDFRSSLDYWHLGRIFNNRPQLNEEFVTANPSTRIFAVTDQSQSHCWVRLYHNLKAIRPMPKFGVPIY